MSEHGAWIGRCVSHRQAASDEPDGMVTEPIREFECHAAVWTDSRAGFISAVRQRLAATGHTLIQAKEVCPVIEWLETHGYHHTVESLAIQANTSRSSALGPIAPSRPLEVDPTLLHPKDAQPWVGHCFFRQWLTPATDAAESSFQERAFKDYACLAVVWTDHLDGFIAVAKRHFDTQGYALTWAEEIHPARHWLNRNGYNAEVLELSPRVGTERRIEIGTFTRLGKDGQPLPEVAPVVVTCHEIPALADQAGIPFWERQWIPPQLDTLLFGQPEGLEPRLNTYFLVDATLRKQIVGAFDLDIVDVPVKCLFDGEGSMAQQASAPHLIDLTLPENARDDVDLVPRFHKDLFERHWEHETGIVIRTEESFETTRRHCQQHMKVDVEGEKRQLFLRYWHPETLDTLLPVLEKSDAYQLLRNHQLIYMRAGEVVQAKLNPALDIDALSENHPFTLKKPYMEAFQRLIDKRVITKVEKQLLDELPHTDAEVRERVADTVPSVLHYIRERSGGMPVVSRSCFELSLLVLLLGPASRDLLESPLLNERLMPIDHRVALAREWYLETLKQHTDRSR